MLLDDSAELEQLCVWLLFEEELSILAVSEELAASTLLEEVPSWVLSEEFGCMFAEEVRGCALSEEFGCMLAEDAPGCTLADEIPGCTVAEERACCMLAEEVELSVEAVLFDEAGSVGCTCWVWSLSALSMLLLMVSFAVSEQLTIASMVPRASIDLRNPFFINILKCFQEILSFDSRSNYSRSKIANRL